MKKLLFLFALLACFQVSPARAQLPPPVDLGIQNIPQDTDVWCWAAVSQQIIMALRGPASTPPQCALVAVSSNVPPQACCANYALCRRTGALQEIQRLILQFGGHFSSIAPPADPITIYQTLRSGKAIIMSVQASPMMGHVVVIRGMVWVATPMGPQAVLLINDPMAFFTQPVPFTQLLQYWNAAIVVY
jgi:hypothetical protein